MCTVLLVTILASLDSRTASAGTRSSPAVSQSCTEFRSGTILLDGVQIRRREGVTTVARYDETQAVACGSVPRGSTVAADRFVARADAITYDEDTATIVLAGNANVQRGDGTSLRGARIVVSLTDGRMTADTTP